MQRNGVKKATLRSDRWEVGGEFHWMGLPPAPFIPWPDAPSWYLLGRHALVALLRSLPPGPRRLWVPSYFCFDVSDYWGSFIEVVTYRDDPRHEEPEWSTLRPEATDVVVAVNYFGVRSCKSWRSWRDRNPCVLVDDHSHDPVSGWALKSAADYAFASLRKTLPIPDGSILWSPRGLPLPAAGNSDSAAVALKLAAMLWKREYLLGGATPEAKATYRAWQQEGERAFDESPVSCASNLSRKYLGYGVPAKWRKRRVSNTKFLLSKLHANSQFRPVFSDWPRGAAPLGAVLEFDSPEQRNAARQRLQEHGIYCPIHWPATKASDPAARDLAGRLLTIPTDQRYTRRDMEKIAVFLAQP